MNLNILTVLANCLGNILNLAATIIPEVPSKPIKYILRVLELLHLSPLYRWVYDTADQESFLSIEKAEKDFGFSPKDSNQDALIKTYKWYLEEGKEMAKQYGTGHRVAWKQGALGVVKHLF